MILASAAKKLKRGLISVDEYNSIVSANALWEAGDDAVESVSHHPNESPKRSTSKSLQRTLSKNFGGSTSHSSIGVGDYTAPSHEEYALHQEVEADRWTKEQFEKLVIRKVQDNPLVLSTLQSASHLNATERIGFAVLLLRNSSSSFNKHCFGNLMYDVGTVQWECPVARRIFILHMHPLVSPVMHIVTGLLCLIAVEEPAATWQLVTGSGGNNDRPSVNLGSTWYEAHVIKFATFEVVLVVLLVFEVVVQVYYQHVGRRGKAGWADFLRSGTEGCVRHRIQVLVLLLLLSDAIAHLVFVLSGPNRFSAAATNITNSTIIARSNISTHAVLPLLAPTAAAAAAAAAVTAETTAETLLQTVRPTMLRWSRPFRATYFFFINRSIRACLRSSGRAIRSLFDLALLTCVVIFVFGLAAVALFKETPGYAGVPGSAAATGSVSAFAYGDTFRSIGDACLTMFVLLTFDNFPSVFRPAIRESGSSTGFFICFVMVVFVILGVAMDHTSRPLTRY